MVIEENKYIMENKHLESWGASTKWSIFLLMSSGETYRDVPGCPKRGSGLKFKVHLCRDCSFSMLGEGKCIELQRHTTPSRRWLSCIAQEELAVPWLPHGRKRGEQCYCSLLATMKCFIQPFVESIGTSCASISDTGKFSIRSGRMQCKSSLKTQHIGILERINHGDTLILGTDSAPSQGQACTLPATYQLLLSPSQLQQNCFKNDQDMKSVEKLYVLFLNLVRLLSWDIVFPPKMVIWLPPLLSDEL